MPRQLRIEYEGAIYHVMNRGDRREDIVRGDADRELWIKTLTEACAKCDWQVHAHCLMSNHFHLVVETPLGNLVSGMKWLLGTYTIRFNARHRLRGHLFAGRYKSLLVDESDHSYLRVVCDYVHLNLARERADTTEIRAERIIQSRLEEIGWSEKDLCERGKCAPEKVRIAQQLRAETTLSLKRVAERLGMGTWTNLSSLLYKAKATKQ